MSANGRSGRLSLASKDKKSRPSSRPGVEGGAGPTEVVKGDVLAKPSGAILEESTLVPEAGANGASEPSAEASLVVEIKPDSPTTARPLSSK
eukprot:6721329-Pyramimonas_sp.AAC.1